jgi:hypothetical protein
MTQIRMYYKLNRTVSEGFWFIGLHW